MNGLFLQQNLQSIFPLSLQSPQVLQQRKKEKKNLVVEWKIEIGK